MNKFYEELDEEEDEMPLGGSVNAEPKENDTVEQKHSSLFRNRTRWNYFRRGNTNATKDGNSRRIN